MNIPNIDPAIFRAYDIRGIIPDALDPEVAHLIGQAFATRAMSTGATKIVVGRDGRLSSEELAAALIDGIVETGLDTIDLGMVPTPSAYWAAFCLAGGNCAVITGSHNPKEYNGIKMLLDGQALSSEEIQGLRILISENRFSSRGAAGMRERNDNLMDAYTADLLAGHKLARPLKVVVDCGNGVMGPFAPLILRKLGCEVIELFCEVDGNFPNHHPDPSVPDNFAEAATACKQHQAEIALGFDGDGDRLGVWLPDSGIIFPDRLLMALAADLLHKQPGATILFDVKCSKHVGPYIAAKGGKPQLCRTGHSFMKRELIKTNSPLGGELSGHFFFNEGNWRFDDALLAAIKFLELIAAQPSAEKMCAQLPNSHASPEYKIAMPDDASPHDFVALLNDPDLYPGHQSLITIDGVRAEWVDGFGLIRASNTTPSIILRFEGDNAPAYERILQVFRDCIGNAYPKLRLPF